MDLEPFLETPPAPLPQRPVALFVGVLERYKAVDVLAEAWRRRRSARARTRRCTSSGAGRSRDVPRALVADLPGQTRWTRVADDAGGRARARRGDRARAPVALGGPRPRRRRGVLPRPRGRREPRRRDPGHRRGRRDRAPRPAGRRRRARRRARARALRPRARRAARARGAHGGAAVARDAGGVRRAASASSSTRSSRRSPPTLTRCGRTGRSSS